MTGACINSNFTPDHLWGEYEYINYLTAFLSKMDTSLGLSSIASLTLGFALAKNSAGRMGGNSLSANPFAQSFLSLPGFRHDHFPENNHSAPVNRRRSWSRKHSSPNRSVASASVLQDSQSIEDIEDGTVPRSNPFHRHSNDTTISTSNSAASLEGFESSGSSTRLSTLSTTDPEDGLRRKSGICVIVSDSSNKILRVESDAELRSTNIRKRSTSLSIPSSRSKFKKTSPRRNSRGSRTSRIDSQFEGHTGSHLGEPATEFRQRSSSLNKDNLLSPEPVS